MVVDINELKECNIVIYGKIQSNWDNQTLVLLCDDIGHIGEIRKILHNNRKPNSTTDIQNGIISDGFVNLNYKF